MHPVVAARLARMWIAYYSHGYGDTRGVVPLTMAEYYDAQYDGNPMSMRLARQRALDLIGAYDA